MSVGYMDPGNWATDLQAGAQYRFSLMWVVLLASVMAILLQVLAARLGIVSGKDLAQACRDEYPEWTRIPGWLLAETGIIACDLAEVLGGAVALQLLFHIPLAWAVLLTAADVLLLLGLQRLGMRWIEAVVLLLVCTIGIAFFLELFVLPRTRPDVIAVGAGMLWPNLRQAGMATAAVGIIGATVMPHNLYLHSALVQTRQIQPDRASLRRAIHWSQADVVFALSLAFLVNAAILILAGTDFYGRSGINVAGTVYAFTVDTDWIRVAYFTLTPLLGAAGASLLFALALLASGQSSTITGTLAGEVVMNGFLHLRVQPWLRRLITRSIALIPALFVTTIHGGGLTDLLVLSQIVLALQLPFAMFPLLHLTGKPSLMGRWRTRGALRVAGWASALLITGLDLYGLPGAVGELLRAFGHG